MVLLAARALEQARAHADRGGFEAARKLLSEAAEELRRLAPGSSQTEELIAQAEMLEGNLMWMSEAGYGPSTRKAMNYQTRVSRQRRKK